MYKVQSKNHGIMKSFEIKNMLELKIKDLFIVEN